MIRSNYYLGNRFLIKKLFLLLFSVFLLIGCSKNKEKNKEKDISQPLENTLSKAEIDDGWELLFDGKSFNGWRGIGRNTVPDGHWKIEDNCIKKIKSGDVPTLADGQPAKGGDLMTDQTFNNFEFKFDWRISEAGNSGVKYNVIEEYSVNNGSTSALGYEYQVLDDEKHSDNANPTHRTASLYDMIQAVGGSAKPIGEFNTGRIVFNNNHGEHWLNGVKVVEYDIDSPEFEALFEKSKYAKHEDFTKHKIASIILQDHGNDCWYKNIKIRKLN
jgi:hypothetical protein